MNLLAILGSEEHDPSHSVHWLWPEQAELIYGSIASVIIFFLIWKFAGPSIAKAMSDRTEGIQTELDDSASAKSDAEAEAADIRQAAGDIDSERQRLFTEADTQAEALLIDGRARLDAEVADLESRADADIASMAGRAGDELRADMSRLANEATDRVLAGGIDAATQQDLIESFIQKVGQS